VCAEIKKNNSGAKGLTRNHTTATSENFSCTVHDKMASPLCLCSYRM